MGGRDNHGVLLSDNTAVDGVNGVYEADDWVNSDFKSQAMQGLLVFDGLNVSRQRDPKNTGYACLIPSAA